MLEQLPPSDTYAKVAACKLYTTKTPITAADLLNDRVLPMLEDNGVDLIRILADRGTKFCGVRPARGHALKAKCQICLEPSDECVDAECGDGRFCNGDETCDAGRCQDDSSPCSADEICVDIIDKCVEAECIFDVQCDDDRFCNGDETCDGGQCRIGGTSPCGAGETCVEETSECALGAGSEGGGNGTAGSGGARSIEWRLAVGRRLRLPRPASPTKRGNASSSCSDCFVADLPATPAARLALRCE